MCSKRKINAGWCLSYERTSPLQLKGLGCRCSQAKGSSDGGKIHISSQLWERTGHLLGEKPLNYVYWTEGGEGGVVITGNVKRRNCVLLRYGDFPLYFLLVILVLEPYQALT